MFFHGKTYEVFKMNSPFVMVQIPGNPSQNHLRSPAMPWWPPFSRWESWAVCWVPCREPWHFNSCAIERTSRFPSFSPWISIPNYPLVNVYIAMERSTMLLMGKSTISMSIFNCYVSSPEGIPNPEFVMKSWNSCFIADCLIRGSWFSGIFRQMSWASEMGFWMPRSFRLGVRWAWGMEHARLPFFDGNPLERWTSAKFVAIF